MGEHLLGIFRSKMEDNMSSAHIVLLRNHGTLQLQMCAVLLCVINMCIHFG